MVGLEDEELMSGGQFYGSEMEGTTNHGNRDIFLNIDLIGM